MSETAADIMARARAREAARPEPPRIDYARMKVLYPKQKAALTRARKSGDRDRVVLACAKAVREWDEVGCWPDGWALWQSALADVFPVFQTPDLADLR